MNGYVIFNKDDDALTHKMYWGWGQGWIWTEAEKDAIIAKTKHWQNPPSYFRAAHLEGENVVYTGAKFKA